jgi:hypothetical protein
MMQELEIWNMGFKVGIHMKNIIGFYGYVLDFKDK